MSPEFPAPRRRRTTPGQAGGIPRGRDRLQDGGGRKCLSPEFRWKEMSCQVLGIQVMFLLEAQRGEKP